jgi:hypothetical protein
MATSRLGRLFGRGRDERADDGTPPAYTGIGAPRQYDPPPGAPGHGTAGYRAGPASTTTYVPARPTPPAQSAPPAVPRPAPSPDGQAAVVTRAQYDEAFRSRRAADQQVGVLERFDAKLSAQIHEATEAGRHEYVRELLSRQRAVRSRLEEAELRRNRLQRTEEELGASLPREDATTWRR